MFDIDSIQTLDSAKIELVHPVDGAPLGAQITVAGPEHPARKKLLYAMQRRLRAQASKVRKPGGFDPEADTEEAIDNLASITLGWQGIGANGKEIPFSAAAARDLYTSKPWIAEQINIALADRENFIVSSKKD